MDLSTINERDVDFMISEVEFTEAFPFSRTHEMEAEFIEAFPFSRSAARGEGGRRPDEGADV